MTHISRSSDCAGERGGSVVECRTPEREVRGSRPTSAVLCPWARHFTPRKLITQEAMAPSRHDWKIVDWDVKPQHNQPTSDFALYLEDYLMYEHHTLGFWVYDLTCDLRINVGHCDLYFMVQWFCLIVLRLFDVWTSYFGIMSQYDTTFDLKINVGHCDLYFMVQWFNLIPWRLFDIWTS